MAFTPEEDRLRELAAMMQPETPIEPLAPQDGGLREFASSMQPEVPIEPLVHPEQSSVSRSDLLGAFRAPQLDDPPATMARRAAPLKRTATAAASAHAATSPEDYIPRPQAHEQLDPALIRDALDRAARFSIVKQAVGTHAPNWFEVKQGKGPTQMPTPGLDAVQSQQNEPLRAAQADLAHRNDTADLLNKWQATAGKMKFDADKNENAAALKLFLAQIADSTKQRGQDKGIEKAKLEIPIKQQGLNIRAGAAAETARHHGATESAEAERARISGEALELKKQQLTQEHPDYTPEAIDLLARQTLTSGAIPSMGMGKAGTAARIAVVNRAAAMKPDADLAANKANYGADTGSLKALQKTADAVDSFEKTSLKNLDQFLEQAKGVVDTGSPLLNMAAREYQKRVAGDPNMTGFEASRRVAVNEIGKILSNPGLSGVLSDSARHEVENLIGPDATLAQIHRAATILKQDMANRKQSTHEQIAAIQGRISGQPTGTVTVRRKKDGKQIPMDAAKAQKFLSDPGYEAVQ